MIICICNNITEEELRKHPAETVEEAYALMDKKPMCRQCLDYAEELMLKWLDPK